MFFLLSSFLTSAQNATVEGEVILLDGDTISGKLRVWTFFLIKDKVRGDSFENKVRIINGNKKDKFKSEDVACVTFRDLNGDLRRFDAGELLEPTNLRRGLYEKIEAGNLVWYRTYHTNKYDNSMIRDHYFWIKGENEAGHSGVFGNLPKRMANTYFSDDLKNHNKLRDKKGYEEIEKFIQDYNKSYDSLENN